MEIYQNKEYMYIIIKCCSVIDIMLKLLSDFSFFLIARLFYSNAVHEHLEE